MEREKRTGFWAKIALFTAALIWGISFFIVKDTTDQIPPNLLLAIRFTIGCAVLAVIFRKRLKKLNREYFKCGAVIGLCLFLAYSSQTIGITDTTPGKNAFLTAVYCVIVPFLFWAVNKTRPDRYNLLAAVICLTGIGMVSLTAGFSIRMGDALTLLGGFFYALHMVVVAKLAKDKDPMLISTLQFGYAAVCSWIVTLVFEPMPAFSVFHLNVAGGILFLALGCTALGLTLQNFGQKYTHPAAASIILSLESVFGVLFSILFYGEKMTARLVLGFVLIFIAILISETKLEFLRKHEGIPKSAAQGRGTAAEEQS